MAKRGRTSESSERDGACLRYGLVGSGQMGRGHIGALEAVKGVEIVALADPHAPSRESALEALGRSVPVYPDHEKLLAQEQLDAVVVATPNVTHADIVCDALDAGVHVLGEKPLSATEEGCARIVAAAGRAAGIYQNGLELRYSAIWQKVRSMIEQNAIGRVRQLWCKEFRGPWGLKVDQWITQNAKNGGTLVEKDCHHFDLFNWFTDSRPTDVAGFGTCDLVHGADRFEGVTPDVLDNAQVVVRYESGAVATLMLCMYCDAYKDGLEVGVIGTEGWIVANQFGGQTRLRHTPREGGTTVTMDFNLPADVRKISHDGLVYFEHLAFRDNIRAGRQPLTDAQVGWWAAAVGMAAERAVAERRVVDMAEFALPA